jgi:hypothetical protein
MSCALLADGFSTIEIARAIARASPAITPS